MRNLIQSIFINTLLIFFLSGCTEDEKLMSIKEDFKGITLNLTIPNIETVTSRGVLPDAGESTLTNVYILFYAQGENIPTLFYSEQIETEGGWTHSFGVQSINKLVDGTTYDVYVLANLATNGDDIKVPTISMRRYALLNLNNSHCYSEDNAKISFSGVSTFTKTSQVGVTENATVTIPLERLVARLDIDLSEYSLLEGYSVESVWIDNAPAYSPFFAVGKRQFGRTVISGEGLNSNTFRFYTFENEASTAAEDQLFVGVLIRDAAGKLIIYRSPIADAIERNKIYYVQAKLDVATTRSGRLILQPFRK